MNKTNEFYEKQKPYKVILKLDPLVMLAQLMKALYNIVNKLLMVNIQKDI